MSYESVGLGRSMRISFRRGSRSRGSSTPSPAPAPAPSPAKKTASKKKATATKKAAARKKAAAKGKARAAQAKAKAAARKAAREKEKAARKGKAVSTAKRAAMLMRRGENLANAWRKSGGDPAVLAKIQQIMTKAPGVPGTGVGLGQLTSADITDIARTALKQLTTSGAFTMATREQARTAAATRTLVPIKRTLETQVAEEAVMEPEVQMELEEKKDFPWLMVGGLGVVGVGALVLLRRRKK